MSSGNGSGRDDCGFSHGRKAIPGDGVEAARPPAPPPPMADSPENPREFDKLISGILGMQDDLKKKEETIKQLQDELDKIRRNEGKKSSKCVGSDDSKSVPSKVILKGCWSPAKEGTSGSPKRKSPRRKKTKKQRAAMEAFMDKVRRRESTTKDWERLVKTMREEKNNRNNFKEKLALAFEAREKGSSDNDAGGAREVAKAREGEEPKTITNRPRGHGDDSAAGKRGEERGDPPGAEMRTIRTTIRVVALAILLLGAGGAVNKYSPSYSEDKRTAPVGDTNPAAIFSDHTEDSFHDRAADENDETKRPSKTAETNSDSTRPPPFSVGDFSIDGDEAAPSEMREDASESGGSLSVRMAPDGANSCNDGTNFAAEGKDAERSEIETGEGRGGPRRDSSMSHEEGTEFVDTEHGEKGESTDGSSEEEGDATSSETAGRSEWRHNAAVIAIVLLASLISTLTGDDAGRGDGETSEGSVPSRTERPRGAHESEARGRPSRSLSMDARAGRTEDSTEVETSSDAECAESLNGKSPKEIGGSNATAGETDQPKSIQIQIRGAVYGSTVQLGDSYIGDLYLNEEGSETEPFKTTRTDNGDPRRRKGFDKESPDEGMEKKTSHLANMGNNELTKSSFHPRRVISQHYSRLQGSSSEGPFDEARQ